MTISSSKDVLNEGLRSHLDQLANSVSYYYGKLQALELPRDLAEDLVIDLHKGTRARFKSGLTVKSQLRLRLLVAVQRSDSNESVMDAESRYGR
jgi:hypothetical protein